VLDASSIGLVGQIETDELCMSDGLKSRECPAGARRLSSFADDTLPAVILDGRTSSQQWDVL